MDDQRIETIWATPRCEPWLGLSSRMLDFVQSASGRTDMVAVVGPRTLPHTAPACFIPARAELHFDASQILEPKVTDPDTVDPNDPNDRAQWPHMMGLAAHEAGHAAFTRLTIPTGTPRAVAFWAAQLEEPRMEGRMAASRPNLRVWLRAATARFFSFANGAYRIGGAARTQIVQSVVLLVGRQRAGVLDEHEVQPVVDAARAALGDDEYATVVDALDMALTADDADMMTMLEAARILAQIVKDNPDDQPQPECDTQPAAGDPGEGEGDSTPEGSTNNAQQPAGSPAEADGGSGPGDAVGDAQQPADAPADDDADDGGEGEGPTAHQMPCGSWTEGDLPEGIDPTQMPDRGGDGGYPNDIQQALHDVAAQITRQATEQIEASRIVRPVPAERDAEDAAKNAARAVAKNVFGGWTLERSPIRVWQRTPDRTLLDEARHLIAALRRANYRGTSIIREAAYAPPGRLSTAELARREGQIARGQRVTATPWQHKRRRETPAPTIRVGISGDVSGSQQQAQARTANLTYAVAQAVRGVGGTAAAVAWNMDVAPILHPNTAPGTVTEAACRGGSSGCPASLQALDGILNLTSQPNGLRVIVVVTDGELPNYDQINRQLTRLTRSGVKVLWITPGYDRLVHDGVTRMTLHPTNTQFGAVVGQHIAKLLETA